MPPKKAETQKKPKLNDFSNVGQENLDITYSGKKMKRYKYTGIFTREKILNFVQALSNNLRDKGKKGLISVNMKYDTKYPGGIATPFGQKIKPFSYKTSDSDASTGDLDDPEFYDSFFITLTR